MAHLFVLGAFVAALIDRYGHLAILLFAVCLGLLAWGGTVIADTVQYAIRARRSRVVHVPPQVAHRPIRSFTQPAAQGLDRQSLNRVVQIGDRR